MTKKDYIMFAKILSFHYEKYPVERNIIKLLMQDMAHEMLRDNPRFDKLKFYRACTNGSNI